VTAYDEQLQDTVSRALNATLAKARMRVAFTVSSGERRDDEPALGGPRGARPGDRAIHLRLGAGSDTWSEIRAGAPGEWNLTDNLFGIGRLVAAGSQWERAGVVALRDGSHAHRYLGRLPQRLGDADDGTVREVFAERLPFDVRRKRLVEAWVDDQGFLRGIAVTTSGPGVRRERKWIALEVWDLGAVEVEPLKDATVLRGGAVEQIRQRWRQVRSSS
jgi:hypothetical protein